MSAHCIRSILLGLLLVTSLAHGQGAVRIDDVRVVDPDAGSASWPRSIAVLDGWIVDPDALDGRDVRVIDGSGRWLIPGLYEMHAHVPPVADAERLDDVLTLFLAHGVTGIRGMLGERGHLELRAELAAGQRFGPYLVTSGPSLNGTSAPDPTAARRIVRTQAEAGYDLLKLHPGLMPSTFAALTEAADGLGIPYAGHVSIGVGLDRALAAGQSTIDHLDGYAQALVPDDHPARGRPPGFFGMALAEALDAGRIPALADRTRAAGVWNVPTQTLIENIAIADLDALAARPAMRYVDDETVTGWRERITGLRQPHSATALERFVDVRRALIRGLHTAGAGLLLGADAPQIFNVPGDSTHHELELLVAAGLSPAEALATGTVNPARFLGQPARGCLRAGCVADAVLLDADPLADISNVRRIRGVLRAGSWLDRADLDARLDAVAARARPAATGPD
ncbi:amidohydrolase family protein [Wenzhouxiangella sp. XN79A]|uniref:amidohydrolase family protein n=1 Tax=Wenzhouxiangella sp. XN79A TaxID=2724193 RepID=UPI00144AA55E|nr:amidohydrolase family protein [Wenzhouxiangella sp. XN79A]NKI33559.1 amidohydrolase family protein [Wenzhouxiangella sp. XN79A]